MEVEAEKWSYSMVSTAKETMIVDSGLRLETKSVARQGFLVLLKEF